MRASGWRNEHGVTVGCLQGVAGSEGSANGSCAVMANPSGRSSDEMSL